MTESTWWREWTLVAVDAPPHRWAGSVDLVIQEIAVGHADRFAASDREYVGDESRRHTAGPRGARGTAR